MALKIAKDHWAFLDEIEAPMWVDLTLEAKSNYQDLQVNDGWFHTSHLFHQLPSLELKAAFAHSGDGSASSHVNSKGSSSPKLPSSVSRSRGKHYRSKKQEEGQHVFPLDKQHPVKALSGKSSWVNSGSGEEIKPKVIFINSKGTSRSKRSFVVDRNLTGNAEENYFKAISSHEDCKGSLNCMEDKQGDSNSSTITNFINSKGTSRSKRSFVVERNLTGNAKENDFKAISCHEDSKGSLSCVEDKTGDCNTSTTTSESDQKLEQKNLEASSRAFGHSSGLLSAIRISLRKSCVITRPASRVDVSNRRLSRDRNSVSGKSSVGSSSNPGYDINNSSFALKQQREQTTDSRKEATTIRATKNKVRESAMSKASNVQAKDGTCNSRRRGTSYVSKPAYHNAAKTKVAKALRQHRVNEQRLLTGVAKAKEKATVCGWSNRLVGAGNENTTGRVPDNQKFHGGDITSRVMAKGQKGTKQDAPPRKGDKTRLAGPKKKVSSAKKGKHPTITTHRLYLR